MVTPQVQAELLALFDKPMREAAVRDRGVWKWKQRVAHWSQRVKTDLRGSNPRL